MKHALILCAFGVGFVSFAHAAIVESGDVITNGTTTIYGTSGVGSLLVDDGSDLVTPGLVRFGESPLGNGTGLVTGVGSSIVVNGNINLGNGGTGLFTIADGASGIANEFYIGQVAGSVGELVVTGDGSMLTGTGLNTGLGANGKGTITVEDNASFVMFDQVGNNPFLRTAQNAGGEATINVRTGGLLDITGTGNDVIHLGERGKATLNIESGGQMLAGRMRVAQLDGSTADINISGAGSTLDASFLFAAQRANTTATIDIENGGRLNVSDWLYVGQAGTGTMNISGNTSVVDVDIDFFVGGEVGGTSGNGSLLATDGATIIVGDDMYIGTDISTGVATLSDSGTTLSVNDRLYVGWGFDGFPATGTLDVGRGAIVNIAESGTGLGLAIAGEDTATAIFTIGDDGTGNIASGLIETGAFFFGNGSATLDLVVDSGITLNLGDMFTLIDYATWDGDLFANVADDAILIAGQYSFLIDYNDDLGSSDFALTATVIPAPTTAALLAFGGVIASRRRR
ncbi:MAG: hypothetical protein AAGB34_05430 [Planctomycetota bacterium]